MTRIDTTASPRMLDVPTQLRYSEDYALENRRLVRLYEHAKRDQWNATQRLDWSIEVDPGRGVFSDELIGIHGSALWERLSPQQTERLRIELLRWQLSQFLHGEQGALLASAQIAQSAPGLEEKLCAATQVMDEARHTELFSRYLCEKVGPLTPLNPQLRYLLDRILEDPRWDMKLLGMQVIIEGLALANFTILRDATSEPLLRNLLDGVIEDEARHSAFGSLALKQICTDLTEPDRREREDFIFDACRILSGEIETRPIWESVGLDPEECMAIEHQSPGMQEYRQLLFSKVIPNLRSLGLLSDRLRERFETLGLLI
ncbi:MAG: ferritin-like domain-containing protein [Planctomycetota bacterium]